MKKKEVIEHLKKVLKRVKKINTKGDIRVYVHINHLKRETDIELGQGKVVTI